VVVGNFKRNGAVLGLKVSDRVLADNALRVAGIEKPSVVVHFKDGSFKEYPKSPKEFSDFLSSVFGGDRRLDNFGERVVMGSSGGFVPPVLDVSDSFCRKFGYELVGHGYRLNADCDAFVKKIGCPNVESHTEHVGLIPIHMVHHHCNNYRCPDCYFWGACVREAQHIDQRLLWLAEKFGKSVEVGMISLPKSLYDASEEVKRKWSFLALMARGFEGVNLIGHPFRYKSSYFVDGKFHLADWYYAYHYHFCGFMKESYSRCRDCSDFVQWYSHGNVNSRCNRVCHCDGFEQLTRRLRLKDGFVVRIFDKRESFFNTAAYELSHAGFKIGAKRVHVSTWFGSCKGVKVPYVRRKLVCSELECKREFVTLRYSGKYVIVTNSKSPFYERDSWMPYMEDGKVAWNEVGVTIGE